MNLNRDHALKTIKLFKNIILLSIALAITACSEEAITRTELYKRYCAKKKRHIFIRNEYVSPL